MGFLRRDHRGLDGHPRSVLDDVGRARRASSAAPRVSTSTGRRSHSCDGLRRWCDHEALLPPSSSGWIDDAVGAVTVHGTLGIRAVMRWGLGQGYPALQGLKAKWRRSRFMGQFVGMRSVFFLLGFVPGYVCSFILKMFGLLRVSRGSRDRRSGPHEGAEPGLSRRHAHFGDRQNAGRVRRPNHGNQHHATGLPSRAPTTRRYSDRERRSGSSSRSRFA